METEKIYYESTGATCYAGMEIYNDFDGKAQKHRVSFEAPLGELTHIKKGQMIPDKKCYKCGNATLIRD